MMKLQLLDTETVKTFLLFAVTRNKGSILVKRNKTGTMSVKSALGCFISFDVVFERCGYTN